MNSLNAAGHPPTKGKVRNMAFVRLVVVVTVGPELVGLFVDFSDDVGFVVIGL